MPTLRIYCIAVVVGVVLMRNNRRSPSDSEFPRSRLQANIHASGIKVSRPAAGGDVMTGEMGSCSRLEAAVAD